MCSHVRNQPQITPIPEDGIPPSSEGYESEGRHTTSRVFSVVDGGWLEVNYLL